MVLDRALLQRPPQGLEVPRYDRSDVRAGIVHIGVGGFHRAHQAMYLDTLMNEGLALDYGICGLGVLPQDARMKEILEAQDFLYTLVLKNPDGTRSSRVIGSIVDYVLAPDDPEAAVERLASPEIRIVSLTVTEGGYNIHHVTGEFDASEPGVAADLELARGAGANGGPGADGASGRAHAALADTDPRTLGDLAVTYAEAVAGDDTDGGPTGVGGAAGASHARPPAGPRTVFGLVVEALARRRARGIPPFTVMSCDNIQGNGHVARKVFSAFATLRDPELGSWVQESVSFPNSMVDRITPVTADSDREQLHADLGYQDAWPVVSEPFIQWVLEDDFPAGRPPWERSGVQVVSDVEPYELMKLRLLNASHQGQCYFGYLAGYRYAHEVCQDEAFADFLLGYMDEEATPTLAEVPGIDLAEYKRTLIERFSNEYVRDTLARLCAESSDRIPKWLLPVIRANLATGGPIRRSAGIVASWARYAEGVDESGEPITVVDRLADRLTAAALRQHEDPTAFLADREVFGDLIDDERFVAEYTRALELLRTRGARETVIELNQEG